ncbi:hypothetical protein F4779DRAFT_379509 [Xylariaceae sp. FL0662B]|nr:hypothetical protein F4779DRAFT_379509 [Xylariaceae sp. FL0662B]
MCVRGGILYSMQIDVHIPMSFCGVRGTLPRPPYRSLTNYLHTVGTYLLAVLARQPTNTDESIVHIVLPYIHKSRFRGRCWSSRELHVTPPCDRSYAAHHRHTGANRPLRSGLAFWVPPDCLVLFASRWCHFHHHHPPLPSPPTQAPPPPEKPRPMTTAAKVRAGTFGGSGRLRLGAHPDDDPLGLAPPARMNARRGLAAAELELNA